MKLAMAYARLANLAAEQGQTVVCATISLFHEVHAWNRANLLGYFEVFLDTPQAILLARDYKNVYQRRGEAVMGQTLPPEWPLNPNLRLTATDTIPHEAASRIVHKIRSA